MSEQWGALYSNAVIYEFLDAQSEMATTDRREGVYCRQSIPPENLTLLDSDLPRPQGQIWIYTLKN